MRTVTALPMGGAKVGLVYEKRRTHIRNTLSNTMRKAAEKIIGAAIALLIAAACVTAVWRIHESCQTAACFNEAITKTALTVTSGH